MTLKISLRGTPTLIDVGYEENLGIYGQKFWSLINDDAYESETFDFIQRSYVAGAYFFDIGAATGCMSIYAAQLGYSVVALEPQHSVFEGLSRNVNLNSALEGSIELVHALVVDSKSRENDDVSSFFTSGAAGPLDALSSSATKVCVQELISRTSSGAKTVLKVDVEGAEFNLLRDVDLLSKLSAKKSIMYLSLHPGFLTPLRSYSKLTRLVWLVNATIEVSALYVRLRKHAIIMDSKGELQISLVGILRKLHNDERDFQVNFR